MDEIKDLKTEVGKKDYMMDMMQQSFNRIQNLLGNKIDFKLFQNLDISGLKLKLHEIEEALENQTRESRISGNTSLNKSYNDRGGQSMSSTGEAMKTKGCTGCYQSDFLR
jgi:hypothetical protein